MRSKIKKHIILSTLVCIAPIVLTLVLYNELPAQVPIHFDVNGQPNGYASKAIAGFVLPCGFAVVNLFTCFMLLTDPKRRNANIIIKAVGIWTVPVLSFILVPTSLFKSMGYEIPITKIITALLGLLLLIIGNYLPKSRQSYTIGIRLPWTLDNEENWYKTHRFGGVIWVLGGIVVITNAFIGSFYIMLGVILLISVLPIIYSYSFYLKQKKEKENT